MCCACVHVHVHVCVRVRVRVHARIAPSTSGCPFPHQHRLFHLSPPLPAQGALAEDYVSLAKAFQDTGFVNKPVIYLGKDPAIKSGYDPVTGEDLGLSQFAKDLTQAMGSVEGASSRFGALATVLNQELAPTWKMFTPPYILLLIRTFLTLEGIAARVDPEFNIYEMVTGRTS